MTPPTLILAPHPDDEVLGVGGTIARLVSQGRHVVVAVLTRGFPPDFPEKGTLRNREHQLRAHRILGVSETRFLDFPAARLDTVAHADLNSALGAVLDELRPHEVYLPFAGDIHLDHQLAALSGMVASRPCRWSTPSAVYAYETLSETNWNAPGITPAFQPNVYVDISGYLHIKLEALAAFEMQIQQFPHERSLEAVEALARLRGATVGLRAAEAFMVLRQVVA